MAAKVVMAVRSLMISPLARNQLSVGSQEIKESVPAYAQGLRFKE